MLRFGALLRTLGALGGVVLALWVVGAGPALACKYPTRASAHPSAHVKGPVSAHASAGVRKFVYTAGLSGSSSRVDLAHAPTGSASLTWNPSSHALTVSIHLTGLAPNSTHPAHIHAGNCNSNGPVLYMLHNVVANAAGVGSSVTSLTNIRSGIPASGWYVNVHNGPGLSPASQFLPIACGNVRNAAHSSHVSQTLGATSDANQHAYGSAQLTLSGTTLRVVVTAHGLVPGSAHAEHIHAGSCQYQSPGSIVYMLPTLHADAHGNATTVATFHGVTHIPSGGWYVNIHRSTALGTQTGFDPIACGNVR